MGDSVDLSSAQAMALPREHRIRRALQTLANRVRRVVHEPDDAEKIGSQNDGLLPPSPSSRRERGDCKRLDQRLAGHPELPKSPPFSRRVEVPQERQVAGRVVGQPLIEAENTRFVKSLLAVLARFPLVYLQ